jgi:hypothetical protein
MAKRPRRSKRGQLVFINLQKRLLSSIEAFYRILKLHADRMGSAAATAETQLALAEPEDDASRPGARRPLAKLLAALAEGPLWP